MLSRELLVAALRRFKPSLRSIFISQIFIIKNATASQQCYAGCIRENGANVQSMIYDGKILWIIEGAVYGSNAWRLYERWALSQSVAKGPTVMCTFKSKSLYILIVINGKFWSRCDQF